MEIYNPEDYLLLSGIQHYFFCKRQWSLIHVEQYWIENVFTVEGKLIHDKVDQPSLKEKRKDVFYSRAMPVVSHELKFIGKLDLVEFRRDPSGVEVEGREGRWSPVVVEYKRGKPKKSDYDEVQLTAQVMALEEALHTKIPISYFYYHSLRRREEVIVTDELRQKVRFAAKDMMEHFLDGSVFRAENYKNCSRCSLIEYCMPRLTKKRKSVENYIRRQCDEET
ncbi:MAG: CRISPR-associated protein Cas4 [Tissierellia bacterium]|nr:CRISPR-associated protein Cas4 [Tissierellia bacterium]